MLCFGDSCIFSDELALQQPLTFDRVSGGRPLTSSFPLFLLPIELFNKVTQYLSISDLKSFSQVDRDCRELARSKMFSNVNIDSSARGIDLVSAIAQGMSCDESQRALSTLHSCIRRAVVTMQQGSIPFPLRTRRDEQGRWMNVGLPSSSIPETEENFYNSIFTLLASLPYILILDWNYPSNFTQEMVDILSVSPVKHLRLHGVQDRNNLIGPHHPAKWNLETLYLDFSPQSHRVLTEQNDPSFVANILNRCAPTLRKLIWKSYLAPGRLTRTIHYDIPALPFLTFLHLEGVLLEDYNALDILLGAKTQVRTLMIDITTPMVSDYLSVRGCIPTLEYFRWINCHIGAFESVHNFCTSNQQLKGIDIASYLPNYIIDKIFLPSVAVMFRDLRSLHLSWENPSIPEESLQSMASIVSLKHLWISAGRDHDWEINHQRVLHYLSSLRALETLTFSGDSYRVADSHPLSNSSINGYYLNRVLPQDTRPDDFMSGAEIEQLQYRGKDIDGALTARDIMVSLIWERWHRMKMIQIGKRYALSMCNLTWCFIGQLSLFTSRDPNNCTDITVTDTTRDPSLSSLRSKWGGT